MLSYPIKIEKDGDTFLVLSPDFPEITTFGENRDDAMMYAVSAFEEAIASRISDREDIPLPPYPPLPRGKALITLPTLTALKTLLYQAMRRESVTKAELARRLSCHGPQVDRLLDLNHSSRMDQIDAAFNAVGQRVSVDVVAA